MPTFDNFIGRLELWETRMKNKTEDKDEDVLVVHFRKMFLNRKFQNNIHKKMTSRNSNSKTKQGYCNHYGKWGHWAQYCDEQSLVSQSTNHPVNSLQLQDNQGSNEDSSSKQIEDTLEAILKTLVKERKKKDKDHAPKNQLEKDEGVVTFTSKLALTTTIPNDEIRY